MKKPRHSPRLEPQRWHLEFCELMKQKPGELELKSKKKGPHEEEYSEIAFGALVGQFFIYPKRWRHWFRLKAVLRAWHGNSEISEIRKKKRSYVRKGRPSISDRLWEVLGALYWNYAARIILAGEYKAMEKANKHPNPTEFWNRLKERYPYLPQVHDNNFLRTVQTGARIREDAPLFLAYTDTAEWFRHKTGRKMSGESLRLMLSPGRLRRSPPASLTLLSLDEKKLLSRLKRTPPFKRSPRQQALIRAIESQVYLSPPFAP